MGSLILNRLKTIWYVVKGANNYTQAIVYTHVVLDFTTANPAVGRNHGCDYIRANGCTHVHAYVVCAGRTDSWYRLARYIFRVRMQDTFDTFETEAILSDWLSNARRMLYPTTRLPDDTRTLLSSKQSQSIIKVASTRVSQWRHVTLWPIRVLETAGTLQPLIRQSRLTSLWDPTKHSNETIPVKYIVLDKRRHKVRWEIVEIAV